MYRRLVALSPGIDDHGKPFRLSGMKGRPEYRYGNEEVGWFLAE
ncbi:hypothetical protein [Streptomyces sp. b94]|nr:hypothetical protein [Streptomyces sp. b94]